MTLRRDREQRMVKVWLDKYFLHKSLSTDRDLMATHTYWTCACLDLLLTLSDVFVISAQTQNVLPTPTLTK